MRTFKAVNSDGEQLYFQPHKFDPGREVKPIVAQGDNGFAEVRHLCFPEDSRRRTSRRVQTGALAAVQGGHVFHRGPIWLEASEPLDSGQQFWILEAPGSYWPVHTVGSQTVISDKEQVELKAAHQAALETADLPEADDD